MLDFSPAKGTRITLSHGDYELISGTVVDVEKSADGFTHSISIKGDITCAFCGHKSATDELADLHQRKHEAPSRHVETLLRRALPQKNTKIIMERKPI